MSSRKTWGQKVDSVWWLAELATVLFCYCIVMVFILGVKTLLNLETFIVDSKNYLFLVQNPLIFYVLQLAKTVIKIAKKLFCVYYGSLL